MIPQAGSGLSCSLRTQKKLPPATRLQSGAAPVSQAWAGPQSPCLPPGCCSALPCPPAPPTLRTTHSPGSGGGSPRGRPASGWGAIEAVRGIHRRPGWPGAGRGWGFWPGQPTRIVSPAVLTSPLPKKGALWFSPRGSCSGKPPPALPHPGGFRVYPGNIARLLPAAPPCRRAAPASSRPLQKLEGQLGTVCVSLEQEPVPSCQPHHAAFHVASRKSSWDTDPRH